MLRMLLLLLLLVAGSPKRLLEMQQQDEKYAAKKLTNLHVMLERRSNLKPSMTLRSPANSRCTVYTVPNLSTGLEWAVILRANFFTLKHKELA